MALTTCEVTLQGQTFISIYDTEYVPYQLKLGKIIKILTDTFPETPIQELYIKVTDDTGHARLLASDQPI